MGSCAGVESATTTVALLLFLTMFIAIGTSKYLGIYLEGTADADARLNLGLFHAFTYLPAPVVAALYRNCSYRRVLLICGSCLASIGIMMTSLGNSKAPIGIFLSVSGLGNCLLLTSTSVTLSDFNSHHFNLIFSLAMSGHGVGMVVLPYLAEFLSHVYGWRGGLLLLGALTANIIPCAVAVKAASPPNQNHTTVHRSSHDTASDSPSSSMPHGSISTRHRGGHRIEDETGSESDESPHSYKETYPLVTSHSGSLSDVSEGNSELSDTFPQRLLTSFRASDFYVDPAFNFFFLAMIFVSLGYVGWHAFIIPHAVHRGLSVDNILLLTISASVGGIGGTLLVGLLSDNRFSPVIIYIICTLLDIVALLCDVFLPYMYIIIVTSCIRSGTIGGRTILGTVAARERASVGKKYLVFALGFFCVGIGNLLGSYYAGVIANMSSSYDARWWLVAGICIEVVIFVIVSVPLLIKKTRR